jgi:hypothetical protein
LVNSEKDKESVHISFFFFVPAKFYSHSEILFSFLALGQCWGVWII